MKNVEDNMDNGLVAYVKSRLTLAFIELDRFCIFVSFLYMQ